MKTLQLSNISLSYTDNEGTGQPILLIHGNSSSGETFKNQMGSDSYKIVAIDLPGHGNSDRFPDLSHYNMPGYAEVIAEAAKELNMEDAVLVGWSLGGHIALEAVKLLPKLKGVVIYGTPPLAFPPAMEDAYFPHPAMGVGFAADITEEQAIAYADAFFSEGTTAPHQPFLDDILKTDGNARAGLAASIVPDGYEDEIKIVESMATPLAILQGSNEQLVNPNYLKSLNIPALWRGEVQIVDNAGHAPHWENADSFNKMLFEFVEDVK
ncbi:MAG: alpha/beta hydrolase [Bacteroidota bacterium]